MLEFLLIRLGKPMVDVLLERRKTFDPLRLFVGQVLFDKRAPTSAFGKTARWCLAELRERRDNRDVRAVEEIESTYLAAEKLERARVK